MVPFNVRDNPSRNVIGVCPYFLLFPVSPDVQEDRLAAAVGRDEAEVCRREFLHFDRFERQKYRV